MSSSDRAASENVTPQPASDVRTVDADRIVDVDHALLAAARAGWPADEPDCTVWRVLSVAHAAAEDVPDERIQRLLPDCTLAEIAAARARVEGKVAPVVAEDATLLERLAEPSVTLREAVACADPRRRRRQSDRLVRVLHLGKRFRADLDAPSPGAIHLLALRLGATSSRGSEP